MEKSFGLMYGTLTPAKGPELNELSLPPSVACFGEDSRRQRQNRIGDEVIGAEENTAGGSREIDDAEWFATLGHGDALNSPAICDFVDELGS